MTQGLSIEISSLKISSLTLKVMLTLLILDLQNLALRVTTQELTLFVAVRSTCLLKSSRGKDIDLLLTFIV